MTVAEKERRERALVAADFLCELFDEPCNEDLTAVLDAVLLRRRNRRTCRDFVENWIVDNAGARVDFGGEMGWFLPSPWNRGDT